MSKLIVIVGATGIQGSSAAETFLGLPGWSVRGTSRNPSSAASKALAAQGVEIVQADFDDPSTLTSAFQGANAIFVVTDFWQHVAVPANYVKAAETGIDVFKLAYDLEIVQGNNAAKAAADPTVLKTLERYVYSSLSDGTKWSKGKYTGVYHYESKAKVVEYIEMSLPELAKTLSTVQIGNYVTNWKMNPAFAPQKQADGSFVIRGVDANNVSPFVVTSKDTGAFVKALVELPAGTNLLGVSEFMTFKEFTELWGKTVGVRARFAQVSSSEFVAPLPEPAQRELAETMKYVQEYGWTGGDPSVKNPDEVGVEIKTTKLVDYFKSEDWSSIL